MMYSNLSQIAIKSITDDTCVINGYIVEITDFPKDYLINER